MILRTVKKQPELPRTTQGEVFNDLKRPGITLTKVNISNTLHCHGSKSCRTQKVPLFKPARVQPRLPFANDYLDDPEWDFEKVK